MKLCLLLVLVLFFTLPAALYSQAEDDYPASLLAEPDYHSIETYFLETAEKENYQEIKDTFLDRAKELVLANQYKPALQILEALLSVDLDNLEVQEIYIAVGKMIKEEEAAELVPAADSEGSDADTPEQVAEQEVKEVAEADEQEEETLTAEEIAQAVAQAVAEAMAQGDGTLNQTEGPVSDEGISAEAAAGERRGPEAASLPDIIDWSLHLGAADLLLYGSQFYTEFYDESQIFLSYGVSLDFEAILKLNKVNLAGEVSFDAFFADFIPLSGAEVSYKLMLGAALPEAIPVPLYARLGFGQLWYLYGDDTPNRLFTAVPSPLLGVKLNGLKLGALFSLDGSIDYYLITFFTSYIASAFDIAAALEIKLPIKSALAFTTRVEVIPTVMIGSGGAETSAKLKISFGIGNDENE